LVCAVWALIACAVALPAQVATQPTSTTAPAGTDATLWNRMMEVDRRAANIQQLHAHFEQKKLTALLKRPLVSTGKITVAGAAMRWDTAKPEPAVMLIDEKEVQLLYPSQKILEIYPIDQRLGSLAASPLPRLEVLKKYFTFAEIAAKEIDTDAPQKDRLGLVLTPIESSLREHVDQVRVLLDVEKGYILRAEMTDSDGDRTTIVFSNISIDEKPAGKLQIDLPPGVKITKPLEAFQGQTDGQAKPK
jgi:outer membrane lipoprotein-sorting protein